MKQKILSCLLLFSVVACSPKPAWVPYDGIIKAVYPDEHWQKAIAPEQLGWSSEKLALAHEYSKKIGSDAVMIVDDGVVIDAWGDITRNFQCHSMRKSLLSGLIGVYVDEGRIDLSKTIAELGIDDYEPSLTPEEKQATIGDLIKARSGIYHPALGESPIMKVMRPKRNSHKPGTFWFYNNWDFNALGTIFEQQTGKHVFEEFDHRIAGPIGMQDFDSDECFYRYEREHSDHPAYFFRMSTRDRARFGLLYLRNGNWNGTQLVAEDWVTNCMAEHSSGLHEISGLSAGIMWGIIRENCQIYDTVPAYEMIEQLRKYDFYMLTGDGGQIIGLIPELDLVLAISGDTEHGAARAGTECIQLLDMILRARMG